MNRTFDYSDVVELADDIHKAAMVIAPEAGKVIGKGALNIKMGWARALTGHPRIKHTPRSINYDLTVTAVLASADIGPDKAKRQAAIMSLIEYGSVNNAPFPAGAGALEAEAPNTEKALADLAERLLS